MISASVCMLSVMWISKKNIAGIQAGIATGLLLFILGVVFLLKFNRVDLFLFDSVRGLLMVIFGSIAYRSYINIVN